MAQPRNRHQFKFWLDMNNDDDLILAEEIDELRKKRSFTQTIRDGIRLMSTLRVGDTSVLFELFPLLKEKLQPVPVLEQPPQTDHIQEQLERIEQLLQKQPAQPQPQAVGLNATNGGGIKQLNVSSFETPDFDEDEDDEDLLIIKKDESSGEVAINNFLKSISALSG